jgi:hypothetical protein
MLFICPVCKQEVIAENSRIAKHNDINDDMCYGSYMFAGHCKEAQTFSRRIKNFFRTILKKIF